MKKWIKRIILIVIVGLVVFAIFNKPEETKTYRTSQVEKGNIESVVSGSGTLVATKDHKEYSKVSAEVEDIYYVEGDKVEKDYPIIKLDSSNYEATVKAQEIAIKQAELSKQNIEKQIKDLEIKSETDGYVSNLSIEKGSYVTNAMAICNIVKDGRFSVVLQFTYYENNPILVGSKANITLVDSMATMTGTVTKVSDMRKLIAGNAQVVDVTIETDTTGFSLEGANAKAEIYNGSMIIPSANMAKFTSINSNIVRSKTMGTVKEVYVNEGKFKKVRQLHFLKTLI